MRIIKYANKRVAVSLSFVLLLILMIALNLAEQFFILLISVCLHEFTHVIFADRFGLKTERVTFTALGLRASVKNVQSLDLYKQAVIYLSGPAVNFLLASAVFNAQLRQFGMINLMLGIFNLIPVMPLDGGKIMQLVVCNKFGIMNGNKILMLTGRFISFIITCVGLIQAVLYPFNISLFCLGVFLMKSNASEYILSLLDFYTFFYLKSVKTERILPVRYYSVDQGVKVKRIMSKIGYGYICNFHIVMSDGSFCSKSQDDIAYLALENGIDSCI